jgi:PAS domain S-box-containing protein
MDPADQELREAELVFRSLLDGTTDVIYLKDRASRYVFANAALGRMLDAPAEDLMGKDDFDLFQADEAALMRAVDQEVITTGEPRTFEETLKREAWTRVYQTTKTPFRGRAGYVIGVIGVSRDITVCKAQELASARLAAIVESTSDAVIGMTLDGTITSWNPAAERMFACSLREALGTPIRALVPPEERRVVAAFYRRLLRGEIIENHETLGVRKDGARIAIALTLSPILDPRGTVVGTSMIGRDITDRKRREREQQQNENWQRLAVEAASLGTWRWDVKDDQLLWTPQCKSIHGLGPDEEVSYERFLTLLHPEDRLETARIIGRAIVECSGFGLEHRVIWPDRSVHWVRASASVLCDDAGLADRIVGIVADVTAEKGADQERAELLRQAQSARAEAQDATRAKDEFLAVLSHELRSPLQSMLGWIQMMKAPAADPRLIQKGLDTIERNVKMQASLIDDLLDVSRIVSGKLRITQERVDLARTVTSALASAKAAADLKSIRVEATLEPLGGHVVGDAGRLEQVVVNLLSNAVKFTPERGSILVRLERERATARLTITDTGAGISAELLPHLFERYFQAQRTVKRSQGGLGLGLAIVHQIVELHGGTVSAESAGTGRGATFTMKLPIVEDERAPWPSSGSQASVDR